MIPGEVIELAKECECRFVTLKFMDFGGAWRHHTMPIQEFDEKVFTEGKTFDASLLKGWQNSQESELRVIADPSTARVDPFSKYNTLCLLGDVHPLDSDAPYAKDPRSLARRAEQFLKASKVADSITLTPEVEFYIFDDVRFDQGRNSAFHLVDSDEGFWNSGREEAPNLAYKPKVRDGYMPVSPTDSLQDIRQEMVLELIKLGMGVSHLHHEAGTGGQCEIKLAGAGLLQQADNVQWLKYLVKNIANKHSKTLTFMPKPLFDENGSGLRTGISLLTGEADALRGEGYAGLNQTALWFIGGLLKHAPAVMAFTNPSTNSYKRLASSLDSPVNLAYSGKSNLTAVRVPRMGEKQSRVLEFQLPDPSQNAYFGFSAMLMAGLDGVLKKIDPGPAFDRDLLSLTPEEASALAIAPQSLEESLEMLDGDRDFLLAGGVFTPEVIDTWIELKMSAEVATSRQRPTPWEFALYFDC